MKRVTISRFSSGFAARLGVEEEFTGGRRRHSRRQQLCRRHREIPTLTRVEAGCLVMPRLRFRIGSLQLPAAHAAIKVREVLRTSKQGRLISSFHRPTAVKTSKEGPDLLGEQRRFRLPDRAKVANWCASSR